MTHLTFINVFKSRLHCGNDLENIVKHKSELHDFLDKN